MVSTSILDEYRRALRYERVRARHDMSSAQIDKVVDQITRFAILVELGVAVDVIQEDADENKLLACAEAGEAEVVVSRDEHLLKLHTYKGIRILSPAAFLSCLNALEQQD